MIDSIDIVFYTALFVLPGVIINSITDRLNPAPRIKESLYTIKCIGFSLVNCAIWSWLYNIVRNCDKLSETMYWVLMLTISMVGSIIVGFIIAAIKQYHILDHVLSKFNIKTIHSTPTAWDYLFAQQASGFVIITLIDDTKLYGWYSCDSFTSSDFEERDIYVEKGYKVSSDGVWIEDEESVGFYVSKEQIKYIEIKKGGEQNG